MLYSILEDNGEISNIYYKSNVISKDLQMEIYNWLEEMKDFKEGYIYKTEISRKQKWYQKDEKYFSSEWKVEYPRWKSHIYCDQLLNYQSIIQNITNETCKIYNFKKPKINSCLINMYRDGNDLIKPHSDNQTTFGENPTVVILSLGQPRTIHFRRRIYDPKNIHTVHLDTKTELLNKSIRLESGSILIMDGSTQKYFCHSIDKEDTMNKRYSMTFREYE